MPLLRYKKRRDSSSGERLAEAYLGKWLVGSYYYDDDRYSWGYNTYGGITDTTNYNNDPNQEKLYRTAKSEADARSKLEKVAVKFLAGLKAKVPKQPPLNGWLRSKRRK